MSESFRDLRAWQTAMDLATAIYAATEAFPKKETYGLTNQVRRAAVGVASDIAEGKGRLSKKEYVQFLSRARGSLHEVDTQLDLSCRLRYLEETQYTALAAMCSKVGKLINGLIRSVQLQLKEPES